jgi:ferredoxin
MFATDKVFEQIYVQELAYWTEGMPMEAYNDNLQMLGIQQLPKVRGRPKVHRIAVRDIPDLGDKGLTIIRDIGLDMTGKFDGCDGCKKCVKECPEGALSIDDDKVMHVSTKKCLGTACYRCQFICPKKVYKYEELKLSKV